MHKSLKLGPLAAGITVAFLLGCLIPQDIQQMNETRPINRPPAFNLDSILPSYPVVEINTACRDEQTEFWAEIIELDVDQELTAIWFWNYDVGADYPEAIRLLREDRVAPSGTKYRSLRPYHLPASQEPDAELDAEGANTLEVFVVETAALDRGAVGNPFFRNLRDCKQEGYPASCISTHPAVMRWTVDNFSEEGLCH